MVAVSTQLDILPDIDWNESDGDDTNDDVDNDELLNLDDCQPCEELVDYDSSPEKPNKLAVKADACRKTRFSGGGQKRTVEEIKSIARLAADDLPRIETSESPGIKRDLLIDQCDREAVLGLVESDVRLAASGQSIGYRVDVRM